MVLVLNKPSATGCCCSLQPAEIDRGGEEGQAVSDAEGKPAEEPKELVADARILVAGFDASLDRLGAMGCLASLGRLGFTGCLGCRGCGVARLGHRLEGGLGRSSVRLGVRLAACSGRQGLSRHRRCRGIPKLRCRNGNAPGEASERWDQVGGGSGGGDVGAGGLGDVGGGRVRGRPAGTLVAPEELAVGYHLLLWVAGSGRGGLPRAGALGERLALLLAVVPPSRLEVSTSAAASAAATAATASGQLRTVAFPMTGLSAVVACPRLGPVASSSRATAHGFDEGVGDGLQLGGSCRRSGRDDIRDGSGKRSGNLGDVDGRRPVAAV